MVAKCVNGTFIPPGLFEIGGIDELQDERFGPILHVVRFKESGFENVLKSISKIGFGVAFGIHSRIDSWARMAARTAIAGNVYVNRNMTGAVVES
jgi:RHH-type proline utilization regulon transcriptional repressor/proline dehydrogenase/delta 1-pyrroline-5-carboxylate dehydrogenase